jgi:hypothetical protein
MAVLVDAGEDINRLAAIFQEIAVSLVGNDRMILISASCSLPRGPHEVHQNLWIYSLMSVR